MTPRTTTTPRDPASYQPHINNGPRKLLSRFASELSACPPAPSAPRRRKAKHLTHYYPTPDPLPREEPGGT